VAKLARDPRRAISEEGMVCLECGGVFRHLTNTHLEQHGLTSADYKRRFGENVGRSLMALAVPKSPRGQRHPSPPGRPDAIAPDRGESGASVAWRLTGADARGVAAPAAARPSGPLRGLGHGRRQRR
jgi:hypothetical protein